MKSHSLRDVLEAMRPQGTASWLCLLFFFIPFAFYSLTGGELFERPPVLDVGIVTVSAALGGLVLNAAMSLKGCKRKETVHVAQKFIAVVILIIIFLPSLHFVELMGGVNLDSFQPDSIEAWVRGFYFWIGALSFYGGIALFIVALADLVHAMLGIDRMEHALVRLREDPPKNDRDPPGSVAPNQVPRLDGALTEKDKDGDWTPSPDLAVVTGAFSYTGRYVAMRLLDEGIRVRTLTRNPNAEGPLAGHVEAAPLDFSDPDGLRRSMRGASVLYNTYWIRYARGEYTFERAVENTGTLFKAATEAGVERIVHFSVTNPSHESDLAYFRAKAQVEDMLEDLGVSYAIIRPTLVYGDGDLLLNNMSWALRRFPIFPIYGKGDYLVQPVYVEDLAAQAFEAGSAGSHHENLVVDAAGPETFSFEGLLRLLASAMEVRARLVHMPPSVGLALTQLTGLLKGDHALTRDEVVGLMAGLLTSEDVPTGTTRLSDWLKDNAEGLGRRYVSELRRNFRLP